MRVRTGVELSTRSWMQAYRLLLGPVPNIPKAILALQLLAYWVEASSRASSQKSRQCCAGDNKLPARIFPYPLGAQLHNHHPHLALPFILTLFSYTPSIPAACRGRPPSPHTRRHSTARELHTQYRPIPEHASRLASRWSNIFRYAVTPLHRAIVASDRWPSVL